MGRVPTTQLRNAFNKCKNTDYAMVKFGATREGTKDAFLMVRNGDVLTLEHYGTVIFQYNYDTRHMRYGGWSMTDRDNINGMCYLLGLETRVYYSDYALYVVGTGPRSKKRAKSPMQEVNQAFAEGKKNIRL